MLRTGILMPRSTLYPSLGLDILNGLKQSLKHGRQFDQVKLLTDNIGFGTDEPDIYTKAEKMLLQEDADLVLVCADARIAEMLQPLFTASNKILMVVNFGASFPDSWQPAPTTVTHTLNFSLHTRLTGLRAAELPQKAAVNIISYYDGGYRFCYNMLNTHQQNGGIPLYNHITALRNADFTLEPVIQFIETNPDVQNALCLFSGEQAAEFYRQIAPVQQKKQLRLFVSPMMLEESLLARMGNDVPIGGVEGYIPWHHSLNNDFNKIFCTTYQQATGQPANIFSLLGWDAGLIIQELLRQMATGSVPVPEMVKNLAAVNYDSPRGWMKIDAATHQSYGPSFPAKFNEHMQIVVGEEHPDPEATWRSFIENSVMAGEGSSWRNTYLCI